MTIKQPTDYVQPCKRTSPIHSGNLPPGYLAHFVIGLTIGFILGGSLCATF